MEKIFIDALKKQLRNKIKGCISVHINQDTLIVDIRKNDKTPWRYTISKLAVQINIGLSSRIVADVITKQYKTHILKTYFY